jgi:TetR/AcrR family transcriptional repressor of nem operon
MASTKSQSGAKTKLLDAALSVIRTKGYSATTVDDICEAAGVTKGAFFHHFKSKEDLAVAAAGHFSSMADRLFSTAPYRALPDPVDRLLGYLDFRKAILQRDLHEFTCLLGTMVQEAYETHPAIREACNKHIGEHAAVVEADISEAIRKYGIAGDWSAGSLALYTQAVLQGAFILAKAKHGPDVAGACLDHLRRYLEMLFVQPKPKEKHKREFNMTKSQMKMDEQLGQLESPRLENGKAMLITGTLGHFTDATWEGIPGQWQRFASHLGKIPGQIGRTAYGLCFPLQDGFDYLSGVEVSGSSGLPSDFKSVRIPAQRYLAFLHREHVSKLHNTCQMIFQWLPTSGHEPAKATGAPDFFERYGENFDPQTGYGDIEVWVPVKA